MQRKFLTNLALLLFLNILVKPFYIFGIDRTVQNIVEATDYGFYFTIFNFAFLFSILLDAGLTNFNNRNIAQNQHLLQKHFSNLVVLKFLLAIVYVAVTFLVALIIGYNAAQLKLLAWVGFNQFLLSFILYLRSNVSGMLMFKTDSFLSVLDRILMILICGVLIWGNVTGGKFRIEWFVYAQTAAYLLTLAVAFAIVIRKAAFKKLSFNLPFFLVIIKRSMPFAILVLLMAIYNRVDSVFIERILKGDLGNQQSGIYAQAFRLLDAANQFAFLFAVLLLPIYSRMIKLKRPIEEMVRMPFSILITVAIIVAVGSFYYRQELMNLLYPRHLDEPIGDFTARLGESSRIYGILMFCFLGTCTMYVFSTLLTANGNLKQLNLVALGGISINFALNIALVPVYQATGSAWASLTTQIVTSLLQVILVQYYFRFKVNYRFILTIILFTAGVILFNWISKKIPINWLYSLTFMVVLSFILAGLMRMVSIRSFIGILKQRETE